VKPGLVATVLLLAAAAAAAGGIVYRDQSKVELAKASVAEGERHLAAGKLEPAKKAFTNARVAAGQVTALTLQAPAAFAVSNTARAGLRTCVALETFDSDPLGSLRALSTLATPPPQAEDAQAGARASLLVDAAMALEAREAREAVDQAATVYKQAVETTKATGSPRLAEAALGQRRVKVLTSLRDAIAALQAENNVEAGRLAKDAKSALDHSESPFHDAKQVEALGARVDQILAEVKSQAALTGYARTVEELYRKVDSEYLGTLYSAARNLVPPKLKGGHPRAAEHATRLKELRRQQSRVLTVSKTFRGMVLAQRTSGVLVFVGKTEVTNAEFQRFVKGGGYGNEKLWSAAARSRLPNFVDRTGKPGPKYWSRGAPPKGRGRYPVRGVSYFEAEAYAKWLGRRLPTSREWRAAAAKPGDLYPWGRSWQNRANVRTKSAKRGATTKVGSKPDGASPTGALDMVGNVRELVRLGDGKYAGVGGSFNDSPAKATVDSSRRISATIRASDTGFRCAKELKWDR
jgi:hypothetical protein